MIRSALLLCAAFLAAMCSGCIAATPPPDSVTTLSAACRDGTPFLSRVQFVQNGWLPDTRHPDDPPPMLGAPLELGSDFAKNLQNAFALAPQGFQDRLCKLAAIYVNGPTNCAGFSDCVGASWGYRAWRTRNEYVAISAGLWKLKCGDGSPYKYHCFESDLLNLVLDPLQANPTPPQYTAANSGADNFDMLVLAVLAHEVGHAVWYEAMNPGNPGSHGYNPGKFCNTKFFPWSWQSVHEPPFWRSFGEPGQDEHRFFPGIADIDDAKRLGQWSSVLSLVKQLYQPDQPWASYFASVSPDEDFVETFKLVVLTNAQTIALGEGPLTNLSISLAGIPHDIPADYLGGNKELLSKKAACVAPWIKP
jgi:hypothetical protein